MSIPHDSNPDPLGAATDRLAELIAALVPEDKAAIGRELGRALGTWSAELINRATALAAGSVVQVHTSLSGAIDDLRETNARIQRRQDTHSRNFTVVQQYGDARLDAHEHGHVSVDEIERLLAAVYMLAGKVQAMERQVGGGGDAESR